jgi:succinyl-diaminopimelate desuccinylase
MNFNPLPIAQALLRVPSICPEDNGAIDVMASLLMPLGFQCEKLYFTGNDGPDTMNLFAWREGKTPGPHFCFAGHTDVVPAGDVGAWTHDPFGAAVVDDILYGRGAVDMKGAIAAFVAAVEKFPDHPGTLSLLITGNEEGVANNGTPRVLGWLKDNGIKINHCIVGEPTSENRIGDVIKNGRRGSFSANLTVHGIQGHVAHPMRALNANHLLGKIIARLTDQPLDNGNRDFPPSTLQITEIKTMGEVATNVVPAIATAQMNIRYNTTQSPETLARWLKREIDAVMAPVTGGRYVLETKKSADVFLTPPADYVQLVSEAVMQETGMIVTLATNGGTSDARFIKDYCPVLEIGLKNNLAHHVNESVPLDDLQRLSAIYHRILTRYFAEMAS